MKTLKNLLGMAMVHFLRGLRFGAHNIKNIERFDRHWIALGGAKE